MPMFEEINSQLITIMDVKVDHGNSMSAAMLAVCVILVAAIAAVITIALAFSTRLGKNIAAGISKPLVLLGNRLEDFAKGDLFTPFPDTDTEDEVADQCSISQSFYSKKCKQDQAKNNTNTFSEKALSAYETHLAFYYSHDTIIKTKREGGYGTGIGEGDAGQGEF